jgi:hypothetical protein
MPALQRKGFALHVDPRHRMGLFVDGPGKLFRNRGDFGSAPKLALMASCTFGFIDH